MNKLFLLLENALEFVDRALAVVQRALFPLLVQFALLRLVLQQLHLILQAHGETTLILRAFLELLVLDGELLGYLQRGPAHIEKAIGVLSELLVLEGAGGGLLVRCFVVWSEC